MPGRAAILFVSVSVVMAGCASDSHVHVLRVPARYAALRRSLHLPVVKPGARCPVSAPGRRVNKLNGPVVGHGPVYLFTLEQHGVRQYEGTRNKQSLFPRSPWGGSVLKWIGRPAYHGPVLVRGRQLDGPHALGFSYRPGGARISALLLPAEHGHRWHYWGNYARLGAPGCYGLQVDGTNFSEIIVFSAKKVAALTGG